MNQERLLKVLIAPHISEKSHTINAECNQIAFKVLPCATKAEIKTAVQVIFEKEVLAVTTVNVKGKTKRGRTPGVTKAWKKAYVTLKAGQNIDFGVEK